MCTQVFKNEDLGEGDGSLFLLGCLVSDVLLVLERVE